MSTLYLMLASQYWLKLWNFIARFQNLRKLLRPKPLQSSLLGYQAHWTVYAHSHAPRIRINRVTSAATTPTRLGMFRLRWWWARRTLYTLFSFRASFFSSFPWRSYGDLFFKKECGASISHKHQTVSLPISACDVLTASGTATMRRIFINWPDSNS
jgi:hypothetical protein